MDKSLQQELIESLFNDHLYHSPAENAARAEILWLRSQVIFMAQHGTPETPIVFESWNAPIPQKKAEKVLDSGEVVKKARYVTGTDSEVVK